MGKSKEVLRIEKLRKSAFTGGGKEVFLITSHYSIMYLTGFTGGMLEEPAAAALIFPQGKNIFVTDPRYKEEVKTEVDSSLFRIVIATDPIKEYLGTLKDKFAPKKVFRLLVEDEYVTLKTEKEIKKWWPLADIVGSSEKILNLRRIKDKEEIRLIKKAVKITEQALQRVLKEVRVGVTEKSIAAKLGFYFKELGASGESFPLQVLAGDHSVLPHGVATERKIEKGDVLQFDIGCVYRGYCSDMSRVFIVGANPTEEQRRVYQVIRRAQKKAIACIKPGVDLHDVFKKHRTVFRRAGFEPLHALGHGTGLEIHEGPSMGKQSLIARQGYVVTCEPGIYIRGKFGMRLEDLGVITREGYRVFNTFPKDLRVLGV